MQIEANKSLREYSTFKIGGNARFFVSVESEDDVVRAVSYAKEKNLDIFVLGGGSNILVSDTGYSGLVIKMDIKGIDYRDGGTTVTAGGGEDWDSFVDSTISNGSYGLENLSYIPGTVGASPIQNIGAYGVEVKDYVTLVRAYDIQKEAFIELSNRECEFEYRNSFFKKNTLHQPHRSRYIVTKVTFALHRDPTKVNISYRDIAEYTGPKSSPSEVRDAVIAIRKGKLPDWHSVGTAGSFFKNPIISREHLTELIKKYPDLKYYENIAGGSAGGVKVSLAWILDNVCGYKGYQSGNVGVYKSQALVLIAKDGAKSEDVLALAEEMTKSVKDKTGIDIEMEVECI